MANIDDILKLIEASKLKVDTDKKISIHYLIYFNLAWIIILLIVSICIMASIDLTELKNKELVNMVTNFATVLSIILSISSILFAYFTSRDTNNQYIAMGRALEEVRATNFQMTISNSDLIAQVNLIAKDVSVINTKYDLQGIIAQNSGGNIIPKSKVDNLTIPGNNEGQKAKPAAHSTDFTTQ